MSAEFTGSLESLDAGMDDGSDVMVTLWGCHRIPYAHFPTTLNPDVSPVKQAYTLLASGESEMHFAPAGVPAEMQAPVAHMLASMLAHYKGVDLPEPRPQGPDEQKVSSKYPTRYQPDVWYALVDTAKEYPKLNLNPGYTVLNGIMLDRVVERAKAYQWIHALFNTWVHTYGFVAIQHLANVANYLGVTSVVDVCLMALAMPRFDLMVRNKRGNLRLPTDDERKEINDKHLDIICGRTPVSLDYQVFKDCTGPGSTSPNPPLFPDLTPDPTPAHEDPLTWSQ